MSACYEGRFLTRLGGKDSRVFPVSTFRLHHLESKVSEYVGKTPDIICDLKSQVESFKRKLEVRHSFPCHMSGYHKHDCRPGRTQTKLNS